jgi:hypothetical protein
MLSIFNFKSYITDPKNPASFMATDARIIERLDVDPRLLPVACGQLLFIVLSQRHAPRPPSQLVG